MGLSEKPDNGNFRARAERVVVVLDLLRARESITIEELVQLLPEERWCDVFHTIKLLNRQGIVSITQRGTAFEISNLI